MRKIVPYLITLILLILIIFLSIYLKKLYSSDDRENYRKIPKVVYQTWRTKELTPDIQEIIEENKKMCPNYQFVLYDNEECDQFIRENFDERVYKAYSKINPKYGACKADFWRYCILYKKGGIYLDIKNRFTKDLDKIIKDDDSCILDIPRKISIWRVYNNTPTYEQWLLIFEKNHPYLKTIIDTITNRILNEYIPPVFDIKEHLELTTFIPSYLLLVLDYLNVTPSKQRILFLTGPDAFSEIIDNWIKENDGVKKHRNIDYLTFCMYDIRCESAKNKLYSTQKITHYSNVEEPIYLDN